MYNKIENNLCISNIFKKYKMSRYGNNLIHWETRNILYPHLDIYSGDKSYEMLPDHALIHCQLISHDGKNIKSDGTNGNELVWCKVCDQKCFKGDILYAVRIIKKYDGEMFSTRASQINWPRPNKTPEEFLLNCDKDDNVSPPEIGYVNIGKKIANGVNSDRILPKVQKENPDEEYNETPEEIQNNLKKSFKKNGMSESDASFLTSGVKHMDVHNLKMAKVMAKKGMDEGVKQMFVHPTEGQQMSYGEMRSFYG